MSSYCWSRPQLAQTAIWIGAMQRIRPCRHKIIQDKLTRHNIIFNQKTFTCFIRFSYWPQKSSIGWVIVSMTTDGREYANMLEKFLCSFWNPNQTHTGLFLCDANAKLDNDLVPSVGFDSPHTVGADLMSDHTGGSAACVGCRWCLWAHSHTCISCHSLLSSALSWNHLKISRRRWRKLHGTQVGKALVDFRCI